MTIPVLILVVLAVGAVLASLVGLVRALRLDGLGERRPPVSHEPWSAGHLTSVPPRDP